ncbi:SusC/RagA family TonB-linked outer membrane protein [Chryseolinea soli]|nr:SusC/RagA family TonB-linked outer membrane protein [Chryseolinea soli]
MKRFLHAQKIHIGLMLAMISFGLWHAPSVYAQTALTVEGKVNDAATGESIPGANIVVKGTQVGTVTNADGSFRIEVAEATSTLVFTFVGYTPQEIVVNGRTRIDVTLQQDATQIDEVVVTALGIEREKQSLGYATQEVAGSQLIEARDGNFTNLLSGKVAGLDVRSNAGVGSSTRVILRGESSLDFNKNQPLFVIDGIQINNDINNTSGADFGNGAAEINPADIESVNVLKGPAASALYGSRAGNGVIMITTKRGKLGQGIGIQVNTGATFEDVLRLPRFQNAFGGGNSGQFEGSNFGYQGDLTAMPNGVQDGFDESWGPRLNYGPKRAQFDSPTTNGFRGGDVNLPNRGDIIPTPWVSQPNNVKDFFQTGHTVFNNVAVTGGDEKSTFRLSYTNNKQQGIVPNNDLTRNTLALNASMQVSKRLKADVRLNYVKSESSNRPDQGYGRNTPMYFMLWMTRQVNMNSLRNYWQPGLEGIQQFQYNYGENHNNPFFYQYQNTSTQDKDRVFGNVALTYNFTDNLSLMIRTATDWSIDHRTFREAWSTVDNPLGSYRVNDIYTREMNTDFLLRYDLKKEGRFGASISFGGNRRDDDSRYLDVKAPRLTVPGIYNLTNNAAALDRNEYNSKRRVNSLYAFAQFDYDNKIFLDVSARNDWSSTLPTGNNSYFYPSVSASALINEFFDAPEMINQIKVRAGWADVGRDTDPYSLNTVYGSGVTWGNTPSLGESGALLNPQLKPESVNTHELGINVVLFKGRIDLDVTRYDTRSKNQILPLTLAGSSGYDSRKINAGEIQNKGIEIMLKTTPVMLDNGFRWDLAFNFARNRNKVIELAPGIPAYVQTAPGEEATIEARVGERMGAIYGPGFERVADDGPMKGEIIINSTGVPIKTTNPIYLGNFNPDWTANINNTFSWKGISLRTLFDMRQGGIFVSRFYNKGMGAGILAASAIERAARAPGTEYDPAVPYYHEGAAQMPDGTYQQNRISTDNTASEGIYGTSARAYYKQYYDHNSEAQVFDASFVKLREVALGYTIPQRWLGKLPFREVRIQAVGRNLKLWTPSSNKDFDPEGTMATTGGGLAPGFENMSLPSTKSYGFNLSFKL